MRLVELARINVIVLDGIAWPGDFGPLKPREVVNRELLRRGFLGAGRLDNKRGIAQMPHFDFKFQ